MQAVQLRRARLSALLAAQAATAAPGSGALGISKCSAYALREPVSGREYAVFKIETSGGITGWGETRAINAAEAAQARAILRGRQATEYIPLHAQLAALPNIQAAANMALLDIVGQATKAPVYQVLGGPTRHKVRAMAPLTGADDAAIEASMKRAQAAGHLAFSVPLKASGAPNSGQAFVLANKKRLETLRASGEQYDFVLDCAPGLTPGDAASLADALERMHPLWLDEACELTTLSSIEKVAGERVTPLGFGRTITRSNVFQDLVRDNLIDVFRPDLAKNGITQIRKFAALAEASYIAVAPYHDGGPIGTAAALHLAASLPNFFIQQVPFPEADADRKFRADLAGADLEKAANGYFALPTGPGLGIKVNTQALGKEVA